MIDKNCTNKFFLHPKGREIFAIGKTSGKGLWFCVGEHLSNGVEKWRDFVAQSVENNLGVDVKIAVGDDIPHTHDPAPVRVR